MKNKVVRVKNVTPNTTTGRNTCQHCDGTGHAREFEFQPRDVKMGKLDSIQVEATSPEHAAAILRSTFPTVDNCLYGFSLQAEPRITLYFRGTHESVVAVNVKEVE